MAGRMSNRDRIAQLRAEADAAAKEKEAARAAKAQKPATARKSSSKSAGKTAKPAGRVRMVWNVCNSAGKPVETFPYAQEQEAIATAAAMTESSGKPHFVTKGEVPVE